ncbi:hypothetical protein PCE1_004680 [Barthelona sp. PCE]
MPIKRQNEGISFCMSLPHVQILVEKSFLSLIDFSTSSNRDKDFLEGSTEIFFEKLGRVDMHIRTAGFLDPDILSICEYSEDQYHLRLIRIGDKELHHVAHHKFNVPFSSEDGFLDSPIVAVSEDTVVFTWFRQHASYTYFFNVITEEVERIDRKNLVFCNSSYALTNNAFCIQNNKTMLLNLKSHAVNPVPIDLIPLCISAVNVELVMCVNQKTSFLIDGSGSIMDVHRYIKWEDLSGHDIHSFLVQHLSPYEGCFYFFGKRITLVMQWENDSEANVTLTSNVVDQMHILERREEVDFLQKNFSFSFNFTQRETPVFGLINGAWGWFMPRVEQNVLAFIGDLNDFSVHMGQILYDTQKHAIALDIENEKIRLISYESPFKCEKMDCNLNLLLNRRVAAGYDTGKHRFYQVKCNEDGALERYTVFEEIVGYFLRSHKEDGSTIHISDGLDSIIVNRGDPIGIRPGSYAIWLDDSEMIAIIDDNEHISIMRVVDRSRLELVHHIEESFGITAGKVCPWNEDVMNLSNHFSSCVYNLLTGEKWDIKPVEFFINDRVVITRNGKIIQLSDSGVTRVIGDARSMIDINRFSIQRCYISEENEVCYYHYSEDTQQLEQFKIWLRTMEGNLFDDFVFLGKDCYSVDEFFTFSGILMLSVE